MIKTINKSVNKDLKRITFDNQFSETCITTLLCSDLRRLVNLPIQMPGTKSEAYHGSDIIITINGFTSFAFQAKKISLHKSIITITFNNDLKLTRIMNVIEKFKNDLNQNGLSKEIVSFEKKLQKLLVFKNFSQAHLQFISYLAEQKLKGRRNIPFFLFYVSDDVVKFAKLKINSNSLMIADSFKVMNLATVKTDYTLTEFQDMNINLLSEIYTLPDWLESELAKRSTAKKAWYKKILATISLYNNSIGALRFFNPAKSNHFKEAFNNNTQNIETLRESLTEFISDFKTERVERYSPSANRFEDLHRELLMIFRENRYEPNLFANFNDLIPRADFENLMNSYKLLEEAIHSNPRDFFQYNKYHLFLDYVGRLESIRNYSEGRLINNYDRYVGRFIQLRERNFIKEVSLIPKITPESKELVTFINELVKEVLDLPFISDEQNANAFEDEIFIL